jgi:hypothetical protein
VPTNDDVPVGDPLTGERERVASAIRLAFADDLDGGAALDDAVRRFVHQARVVGYPPERTIGVLKAITLAVCPPRAERHRLEEVGDRVLRACLAEYYDGGRPDASPSP